MACEIFEVLPIFRHKAGSFRISVILSHQPYDNPGWRLAQDVRTEGDDMTRGKSGVFESMEFTAREIADMWGIDCRDVANWKAQGFISIGKWKRPYSFFNAIEVGIIKNLRDRAIERRDVGDIMGSAVLRRGIGRVLRDAEENIQKYGRNYGPLFFCINSRGVRLVGDESLAINLACESMLIINLWKIFSHAWTKARRSHDRPAELA